MAAREPNAVDFWRGYALVAIFVDHIPGLFYSQFTHGNYSVSDAADLFVFLAGWSVRLLEGRGERQQPVGYMVLRLTGRALTLYAAQIMITMIADRDARRLCDPARQSAAAANGTMPRRCSSILCRRISGSCW